MCNCNSVKNMIIADIEDADIIIGQFVEGYHRIYYEYPRTIKDLEKDLSSNSRENYFELRKFILRNIDDFELNKKEETIFVTYKDSIVSVINCTLDPCDYTNLNIPDYYKEIACFDKYGLRVNSKMLINKIKERIKIIQSSYKNAIFILGNNVDELGNRDKYLFVQYTKQNGLNMLCSQDSVKIFEYQYFVDLDMCFSEVVDEFKLSKIIFATKIFF